MSRAVALLICLSMLSAAGFGQSRTAEPEPYQPEEFPDWAHDLRRAEIIAIGSLPFTLFYSVITYEIIRFGMNGWDSAYAPGPFRGGGGVPLSGDEQRGILLAAVSISLTVALADYIIGEIRERNERNERDAE